jgi:hypothetical protein
LTALAGLGGRIFIPTVTLKPRNARRADAGKLAPCLPARHPPKSGAHLFGVFLSACFAHSHDWRHGVLICEATRALREIQILDDFFIFDLIRSSSS